MPPKYEILVRIADLFRVTTDYFAGRGQVLLDEFLRLLTKKIHSIHRKLTDGYVRHPSL